MNMTRIRDVSRIVATLWGGRVGDDSTFFESLQLEPDTPFVRVLPTSQYASPHLVLFDLSFADYCPEEYDEHDPDRADEAFSDQLDRSLSAVASWLNSRHPVVIQQCRTLGIHLHMTIEITIDSITGVESPCFELELIPEFLLVTVP